MSGQALHLFGPDTLVGPMTWYSSPVDVSGVNELSIRIRIYSYFDSASSGNPLTLSVEHCINPLGDDWTVLTYADVDPDDGYHDLSVDAMTSGGLQAYMRLKLELPDTGGRFACTIELAGVASGDVNDLSLSDQSSLSPWKSTASTIAPTWTFS